MHIFINKQVFRVLTVLGILLFTAHVQANNTKVPVVAVKRILVKNETTTEPRSFIKIDDCNKYSK